MSNKRVPKSLKPGVPTNVLMVVCGDHNAFTWFGTQLRGTFSSKELTFFAGDTEAGEAYFVEVSPAAAPEFMELCKKLAER